MAERPSLDEDARARGRELALAARRRRAEIKRQLAEGGSVREILGLRMDDPAVGRMRARDLVEACPGIGPARATHILVDCHIAESRRLRGLGDHQVAALVAALDPDSGARGRGRLLVLSGPSGVGKSSVVTRVRERRPRLHFSVSATTRPPREGEIDGEHYHFVDRDRFEQMIAGGQLLEWAEFAGHLYGTPAAPVDDQLAAGHDVLLEIELQGARQVRDSAPEATRVFLAPPSWDVLVERLQGRRTEPDAVIARRLATARVELAAEDEFDHTVVNSSVDDAADEILRLLDAGPGGRR
ncbi:MAG: guanylate kinase [Candidatus Nanopelagicales bacterium]